MPDKLLADRYQLLEPIGRGGLSEIYKALDKNTGKFVAIKFVRSDCKDRQDIIECFDYEVDAIRRLDHPLIVNLLYVGESEEKLPYIVIEYVDGKTLKDYIIEKKTVDIPLAVKMTSSILAALKHAHKSGIVHGDIKPQNVLMGNGFIKLTDFGASKIVMNTLQHGLKDESLNFGSVHYCSPEQLKGESLSARSDLYSLGIVMYEMLTGQLPFNGDSQEEIARKNKEEKPKLPSQINHNIPKGLEKFIMKALEKNPENRFASAESMDNELQNLDKQNVEMKNDKVFRIKPQTRGQIRRQKPFFTRKFYMRIALAGIAALFMILVLVGLDRAVNYVNVPFLIGENEDVARRNTINARLVPVIVRQSSDTPLGYVIEQSYKYGENIKANSNLVLTISTGPNMQAVPNAVGKNYLEAKNDMEKLGLNVELSKTLISSRPIGEVLRQSPEADNLLEFGSTIYLEISGGSFTMPNLTGRNQKEAIDILVAGGIDRTKIKISEVPVSDRAMFGLIASQMPEENALIMPSDENVEIVLAIYVQGAN